MNHQTPLAAAVACTLWIVQANSAHAQWGYPFGFGGWGWEGWGASTAEGDFARGLGIFAQGAGIYNQKTAEANAINADTMKRWNEYVHQAQMNANQKRAQRFAQDREKNTSLAAAIQKRLRDNPEPRDIFRGAALNSALDEIDDPRVYVKALQAAKIKIGGDTIRNIPFHYGAGAITYSIHELARGPMPAAMLAPEFTGEREAIKALGQQIDDQIGEEENPMPETIKALFAAIYAAEERVGRTLTRNSRERNEAERYLKALHGLAAMLKTPAIDVLLAGVDKRPDATLGELLAFMAAFNLRFGAAATPQQRELYTNLYPKLVQVRDQVAPALASSAPAKTTGAEPADFFAGMSLEDLRKKAPRP